MVMVMISRRKILRILGIIVFALLVYVFYYCWQVVTIGTAYKAKILCSSVFISKRSPQDIMREDLAGIMSIIKADIDFKSKSVTTSFPGVPRQCAIFRNNLGCTSLAGVSDTEILSQSGDIEGSSSSSSSRMRTNADLKAFTEGNLPQEVSSGKLNEALDKAFSEKDPDNPIRTRAVVVVYHGQIIAERYAPGFSADTALPGWSMTKSIINALVGILVMQGEISIDQPVRMAEWSGAGDPRKAITLDQLLRMSSGLTFDERSGPVVSDVNRMLLRSRDTAAYALAKPLRHKPGSYWHYSSGTTNIISQIIRESMGGSIADYHSFPRKALFDKIGMDSAVMEVDAAGTFVGSSFMYATARDWARFGQLYLQDGLWNGERILPSGWVSYSATPGPTAPQGRYGAHFWTNGRHGTGERPFKSFPADTFYASGYEGQFIIIIPSCNLVVVRLGLTKNLKALDMESFVSDVLAAVSITENRSSR